MSKVLTFSRQFPSYHPKKGEPTFFVEKFWLGIPNGSKTPFVGTLNKNLPLEILTPFIDSLSFSAREPKYHTIRAGHRFKAGDMFSPRVWGTDVNPVSGRSGPYHSKQIVIAPDIRVEKTWDVQLEYGGGTLNVLLPTNSPTAFEMLSCGDVSKNDGLKVQDFINWFILSPGFKKTGRFDGQIICWDANINY